MHKKGIIYTHGVSSALPSALPRVDTVLNSRAADTGHRQLGRGEFGGIPSLSLLLRHNECERDSMPPAAGAGELRAGPSPSSCGLGLGSGGLGPSPSLSDGPAPASPGWAGPHCPNQRFTRVAMFGARRSLPLNPFPSPQQQTKPESARSSETSNTECRLVLPCYPFVRSYF